MPYLDRNPANSWTGTTVTLTADDSVFVGTVVDEICWNAGFFAIDETVAIIKAWQVPGTSQAPPVPVVDLHAGFPALPAPLNQINKVINFDDVYAQIQGFKGFQYPGPEIRLCPDP